MDGRVLGEALAGEAPPLHSYTTFGACTAPARDRGRGLGASTCRSSEVNRVRYLDEGDGEFTVRQYP